MINLACSVMFSIPVNRLMFTAKSMTVKLEDWSGTEHCYCMIHDKPSMYSVPVQSTKIKSKIKVDSQA